MANRRQFLKGSALAAAATAAGIAPAAAPYRTTGTTTPPPAQARGGDHFPNFEVVSHTGRSYLFYDQLVRDRVVGINFFSVAGHSHFPATTHLRRVAEALGPKLGHDVFLYSITTDPERDTVERLRELAEAEGVPEGWLLLRPNVPDQVGAVSHRLYKHGAHGQSHPVRMMHYGHGSLGVWGSFGVDSEPGFAAERFSWVAPGPESEPVEKPRRAGPRQLGGDFRSHNREQS